MSRTAVQGGKVHHPHDRLIRLVQSEPPLVVMVCVAGVPNSFPLGSYKRDDLPGLCVSHRITQPFPRETIVVLSMTRNNVWSPWPNQLRWQSVVKRVSFFRGFTPLPKKDVPSVGSCPHGWLDDP